MNRITVILFFIPTQYLESSNGEEVTMCLSSVDLELFLEHYNVYNIEYISGWKFKSTIGLFSDYIDKWTAVKIESGKNGNKAMRTLAKLMLNALYGKFGLNPDVQSKIPYYDNGMIKYRMGDKEIREPIYIPVAVFVTSWARHKTITSAQKMKKWFVYADTDSLHLEMKLPDTLSNMTDKELSELTTKDLINYGLPIPNDFNIDAYELGAWKLESHFHRARFIRQKSYIEDWNTPDTWETEDYNHDLLNITCAGMPDRCYQYVNWENFKVGQTYRGKLQFSHVIGGIVLNEIEFSIKQV